MRKQEKDHGTKRMVEGGSVLNRRVLLLEDLISTGSSCLSAVDNLRKEGAKINECLAIVSYNFSASKNSFSEAKVKSHTLTSFPVILEEAKKIGMIKGDTLKKVENWFKENTQ